MLLRFTMYVTTEKLGASDIYYDELYDIEIGNTDTCMHPICCFMVEGVAGEETRITMRRGRIGAAGFFRVRLHYG
jgi:hypothetical protein